MALGIRFLTAITRLEYANYGATLAASPIKGALEFEITELTEANIAERARDIIRQAQDYREVSEDLFAIDLGKMSVTAFDDGDDRSSSMHYKGYGIQEAMTFGQKIMKLVSTQRFGSIMAAGASLGLKPGISAKYSNLTKLPDQVQDMISAGLANNCSINIIEKIALRENPEHMFEKFTQHLDQCNVVPIRKRKNFNQNIPIATSDHAQGKISVRVVAYFNPQMFADQKDRARRWLDKLRKFESDLNKRLRAPSNKRSRDSIVSEIDRFIRKKDLLQCVKIEVNQKNIEMRKVWQVDIELIQDQWKQRRAHDGFCILLSHHESTLSATELCRLYRDKDIIEKDFQTIKSVLDLRPIRHRTDLKIKAHVTICMLALLLEKSLQGYLKKKYTSKRVLEDLKSCHLNQYKVSDENLYLITELSASQRAILKTLNLTHLADDDYLQERIKPREL